MLYVERKAKAVQVAGDGIACRRDAVRHFLEAIDQEELRTAVDMTTFWRKESSETGLGLALDKAIRDISEAPLDENGYRSFPGDFGETLNQQSVAKQFMLSLGKPLAAALRLVAYLRHRRLSDPAGWQNRELRALEEANCKFYRPMASAFEKCAAVVEFLEVDTFVPGLPSASYEKDGLHWRRILTAVDEILNAIQRHLEAKTKIPGASAGQEPWRALAKRFQCDAGKQTVTFDSKLILFKKRGWLNGKDGWDPECFRYFAKLVLDGGRAAQDVLYQAAFKRSPKGGEWKVELRERVRRDVNISLKSARAGSVKAESQREASGFDVLQSPE